MKATSRALWFETAQKRLLTMRGIDLDFALEIPPSSPAMKNQPFFAKRGDAFIPNPVANGPWNPDSMHGRVVIGLLAHIIEERHGSSEFVPARLTVDMFRLPDIRTPVEVTTRLVRDGLRIKVVEAEFFSGGTGMARASCQLLRRTENAPGNVWAPENWDAPLPDAIPAPTDPRLGMNGKWATRPIVGHMGSLGPRRLWMSEVRELVDGEPLTPFTRVAVAADFASPFANAGDKPFSIKTVAPYSVKWTIPVGFSGTAEVWAVAYDRAGNRKESQHVRVLVTYKRP